MQQARVSPHTPDKVLVGHLQEVKDALVGVGPGWFDPGPGIVPANATAQALKPLPH
jgi:hypothetical protein